MAILALVALIVLLKAAGGKGDGPVQEEAYVPPAKKWEYRPGKDDL